MEMIIVGGVALFIVALAVVALCAAMRLTSEAITAFLDLNER